MKRTADVIVVGGGMVGMTTALALAPSGLEILVLDNNPLTPNQLIDKVAREQDEGYDPRVSALTCASQTLLQRVGAWPFIQSMRLSPYTDMDVWDGEGSGHIHFSSDTLHEPHLGHIVENRVTVAALYQAAIAVDNVEIITGAAVTQLSDVDAATGCRTLQCADGLMLSAKLVIAADGAHSKVRQLAAIPMWEWDYGHHAIVTTVETALPHQATAWQRFTEDGPLAFLPLDNPKLSSIVWSTSPDHAKLLMELDDDAFCAALERAFESKLGAIIKSDTRFSVPLRQRHAKYYVQPGLAIVGDAAHTIHPLAGQGVNLGLMDAAALAEQVIAAFQRGEAFETLPVLKRFQRQRQSSNLQMSAMMELFKQLFGHQLPLLKLMRGMGMNALDKFGSAKDHLVMLAMGLGDDMPKFARREQE